MRASGRPAPDIEDRADALRPLLHVQQAEVALLLGPTAGIGGDATPRIKAVQVDDATGSGVPGAMYFDQRIRMPDGRVVSWEELTALVPPPDDGKDWPPAGYTYVALVVPGERYSFVQAREVAALAGGSLVAFAVAAVAAVAPVAVRRRRPG